MDSSRTYEIGRKTASRLLKVSTRTIDRYVRDGKLSARQVRGRVFLSREEMIKLQKGKPFRSTRKNVIGAPENIISKHAVREDENPWAFYKNLYEETVGALDEKNRKLEQANYRIGQLESQTASRLQLPAINHEPAGFDNASATARQALFSQEKLNIELAEKIKREKLNRRVLAGIVYILLILQPILWYFLRPVS